MGRAFDRLGKVTSGRAGLVAARPARQAVMNAMLDDQCMEIPEQPGTAATEMRIGRQIKPFGKSGFKVPA